MKSKELLVSLPLFFSERAASRVMDGQVLRLLPTLTDLRHQLHAVYFLQNFKN